MNEHISAMKFILWAGVIALALSGTVSLSKATYRMAEAAMEAQTKNQLSYGKYSRMLWSGQALKNHKKGR
jgi:hypothetical protein